MTRGSAEFRIERRLTSLLTGELHSRLYRNEYSNADFSETDGLVGGALVLRQGKGLEIKLRYDHTSRRASGAGIAPDANGDYDENRAFLTIGYRPKVDQ